MTAQAFPASKLDRYLGNAVLLIAAIALAETLVSLIVWRATHHANPSAPFVHSHSKLDLLCLGGYTLAMLSVLMIKPRSKLAVAMVMAVVVASTDFFFPRF